MSKRILLSIVILLLSTGSSVFGASAPKRFAFLAEKVYRLNVRENGVLKPTTGPATGFYQYQQVRMSGEGNIVEESNLVPICLSQGNKVLLSFSNDTECLYVEDSVDIVDTSMALVKAKPGEVYLLHPFDKDTVIYSTTVFDYHIKYGDGTTDLAWTGGSFDLPMGSLAWVTIRDEGKLIYDPASVSLKPIE